jgi:hypothetical protein
MWNGENYMIRSFKADTKTCYSYSDCMMEDEKIKAFCVNGKARNAHKIVYRKLGEQ